MSNCYQAAYQYVMSHPDCVLVHGYPTLRNTFSKHNGKMFGHAWVEVEHAVLGWCVIDTSSRHTPPPEFPGELYYTVGRIDPDLCQRYEVTRAMVRAETFGTYGPWENIPSEAVFANDDQDGTVPLPKKGRAEDLAL